MKVYLDTNIISGWAKQDLPHGELVALADVLDLWGKGYLDLCTSEVAKEELEKIPEVYRRDHMDVYEGLKRVPTVREKVADPGLMTMGVGGGRVPQWKLRHLQKILDETDARHFFQAIQNGADVFLTYDKATILARKAEIQKLGWPIDALKPSEL